MIAASYWQNWQTLLLEEPGVILIIKGQGSYCKHRRTSCKLPVASCLFYKLFENCLLNLHNNLL